MKKVALVVGGVALGLLAVACSGTEGPAPLPEGAQDDSVKNKLAEMTGARWEADPGASGKARLYYTLDEGRAVLPSAKDPKELLAFLEPVREGLGVSRSFADELDEGELATEATSDELGTMRFSQHLPGTNIPVFDGAFIAGVRPDGSLAFVDAAIAHGLDKVRATPAFDTNEARRKLESLPGAALVDGTDVTLGVRADDPDAPTLVYRGYVTDERGGRRIDLDAQTGAVVADETTQSHAMTVTAHGAETLYLQSDKKRRPDARYPVQAEPRPDGAHTLAGPGPLGRIEVYSAADNRTAPVTGIQVESGEYRFDFEPTDRPDERLSRTGGTQHAAVNAFYNVSRSADYFKQAFALESWATPTTRVTVHHNGIGKVSHRGDAFYDAASRSLFFGDGILSDKQDMWETQSPAVNVDYVAHEYAHGLVAAVTSGTTRRLPLPELAFTGEAGAINEGIADILASYAQATITGNGGGRWGFAETLRSDNKPLRHFLHPSWGTSGGAVHKKSMRPFTGQDNGNVHYNSTLVSQAWALMANGGFNDVSHLGVTAEMGLERAKWLVWHVLHAVVGAETMRAFADKMIVYQMGKQLAHPTRTDLSPYWVKHTILCAWTAVGVIPPNEAAAFHGVTCPEAHTQAASCKGKVDGTYCDPDVKKDYAAYTCKKGSIVLGRQCQSGQFCHRTAGSFDSKAVTDETGEAKCFAEPQTD